jgi:hypothetical protein
MDFMVLFAISKSSFVFTKKEFPRVRLDAVIENGDKCPINVKKKNIF